MTSVYLIERKHDTNLILLTERTHGDIKALIIEFIWPDSQHEPTCERAHLFKSGARNWHVSNSRIDKAYKELIKKKIIKIKKESGFRGTSKHEVMINENDTAIQLLAIQKRIIYQKEHGEKQFPNMFKKNFMINNFVVTLSNAKLIGRPNKTRAGQSYEYLDLEMPYQINPKYQNDFDAFCFTMDSLFNDISLLAVSMSNGYIAKEYENKIRDLTIWGVDMVMQSIQDRLISQGDHKLTPISAYNMRKQWELLIRFRSNLTWLFKMESKDEFSGMMCNPQLNEMWKAPRPLKLTAEEKNYFMKMKS